MKKQQKRYMHQYNFPAYSVGEARTSRGPGRREIGHGALAEQALLVPVIPSEEEFPICYKSCIRSIIFKWFNITSKYLWKYISIDGCRCPN